MNVEDFERAINTNLKLPSLQTFFKYAWECGKLDLGLDSGGSNCLKSLASNTPY